MAIEVEIDVDVLKCENPFVLGRLAPGERVLDIGSGAGTESLVAANANPAFEGTRHRGDSHQPGGGAAKCTKLAE